MIGKTGVARLVGLLAMTTVVTAGCGDDVVTMENFDRIEIGMTLAEVESIFGQPGVDKTVRDERSNAPDGTAMEWKAGKKSIVVVLFNDEVIQKQRMGRW